MANEQWLNRGEVGVHYFARFGAWKSNTSAQIPPQKKSIAGPITA